MGVPAGGPVRVIARVADQTPINDGHDSDSCCPWDPADPCGTSFGTCVCYPLLRKPADDHSSTTAQVVTEWHLEASLAVSTQEERFRYAWQDNAIVSTRNTSIL